MRIIRWILMLITLASILAAPKMTLAAEEESSETKINFEINENIVIDNGLVKDKQELLLEKAPYKYDGYAPIKSLREQSVEKVLKKYEEKRKQANLPQGQFIINASAYTAAADECGKSDGITASGLMVQEKETIACPPQFPFGTKIKIEGMGTYICEDRGGAIKGNHIDIYMETKREAFQFGRRNLVAEVVM